MEKLRDPAQLAEYAEKYGSAGYTNQEVVETAKLLVTTTSQRDEWKRRAEAAEAALERESDIHIDTAASMREWRLRAEAAEAKLAELAKNPPIGRVDRGAATDSNEYPDARVVCLHEHVGWEAFQDGCELFTRPAPAADLAALVPKNVSYLDAPDEPSSLWAMGFNDCIAAILRNIKRANKK